MPHPMKIHGSYPHVFSRPSLPWKWENPRLNQGEVNIELNWRARKVGPRKIDDLQKICPVEAMNPWGEDSTTIIWNITMLLMGKFMKIH